MCENLMNHLELFNKYFSDTLLKLSIDKVVNVRILIAKILFNHFANKSDIVNDPIFS